MVKVYFNGVLTKRCKNMVSACRFLNTVSSSVQKATENGWSIQTLQPII